MNFKALNNIVGWIVFAIAATVYVLTAEPTGSLWDCGEFIAGAHKLQVVHPPGAPLFLMVGRMFTFAAEIFTDTAANPQNIAYAVNVMSGICTAFAALFVFWSTTILGRLTFEDQDNLSTGETIAVLGAGAVAGLATTFSTSVWFSAVEGEVYAMSTFFTTLVMWAGLKWYQLPDNKDADRWLVFAAYMAGLSIGVHLLSLLTFPFIAILYYLKKWENTNFMGMLVAAAAGFGALVLVQGIIILKLPDIGAWFDKLFVNSFGLPFYSGFIFFILLLIGGVILGLNYAHKKASLNLQKAVVAFAMVLVGFSTYGMIVLRAEANTPINMNNPSDVFSFVSYLNREQYGDRPLLWGPHFDAQPIGQDIEPRYGVVDDHYEEVDRKIEYTYNSNDYMLFPRIGHYDRKAQHRQWMENRQGKPSMADNLGFFFKYQINWMYWRYFMWNFVGRQNGEQGYVPWDPRTGHWISGINAIDNSRLYNQEQLPEHMKNHEARNTYYFLPLIFGLFGLIFHFRRRQKDALALLALFLMTGLAIIVYSNQPPNEPRERDYVLVGSIFTFCMWMGMGVLAIFDLLKNRVKLGGLPGALIAAALVLTAPIVMGMQNWDDHSRASHTGARDYAINFLESCEENAIIFTHGDNDTYPLWYAQEVEGIRTDVRVINLSLLAVDWYINQLRRKVNNSPKIEMSIPEAAYRGYARNQVRYIQDRNFPGYTPIQNVVDFMGQNRNMGRSSEVTYLPTKNISIPVDKNKVVKNGTVAESDTGRIVSSIDFTIPTDRLIKDEVAILDILASNNWERPVYFAVTCRPEKLLGLQDYMQVEGMAMRLIPVKTASDRRFGFIGSGRIAVDKTFENIMNDFRWGNFDKEDLYVDRSFNPSVYSLRIVMIRLGEKLISMGDKERAAALMNRYFEAFPNMNFPFDSGIIPLMRIYANAGAYTDAKPHLITLATELADRRTFYQSLYKPEAIAAFSSEQQTNDQAIGDLQAIVSQSGDQDLIKQVNDILGQPITNPPG